MYYVIKDSLAYPCVDLVEVKTFIIAREDIRIIQQNTGNWVVSAFNRQMYVDKTPLIIGRYLDAFTYSEIIQDLSAKDLAKKFNYVITKEI